MLRSTRASVKAKTRRRNIYMTPMDVAIWEEAAKRAGDLGVSLSSYVAEALACYIRGAA